MLEGPLMPVETVRYTLKVLVVVVPHSVTVQVMVPFAFGVPGATVKVAVLSDF
jgi:hypothetical protein